MVRRGKPQRLSISVVVLTVMALLVGVGAADAANNSVLINGQSKAITGTDIYRTTNSLVMYTPTQGATTGTNVYGFEAAVVNGIITQVQNGVGNMAIPANGYVLSGHGTSRTWLLANAAVGRTVTLDGAPPVDPPPANSVTVAGQVKALTGTNITRTTNALVLYTPSKGATTGTNVYGYEVAVVNGVVTSAVNSVGNLAIPSNGFVLSGHGTSRTWLQTYGTIGATVVLGTGGGGGQGQPPAPVVETRQIAGTITCQTLQTQVTNQQRTNTWQWNGTAWVDNWSAWTTTGTATRTSTKAECINEVSTVPSDALLPDIRLKNLNKCGAGDLAATNNTCFKIVNPAPFNSDFPDLEGKKLLKFPVITLNVGAGPGEVIASRTSSSSSDWAAYQTFYRPDGSRQSVLTPTAGFYYAGDGHSHWHFRDFDSYHIESLSGTVLRTAEKHGYCMQDNTTWNGLAGQPGVPANPVYTDATACGKGLTGAMAIIQGLSRGWGDTYATTLPDQALDITGLANGRYRVSVTADAIDAVFESNNSNNSASMEIEISGNTVTTYPTTATGGLN